MNEYFVGIKNVHMRVICHSNPSNLLKSETTIKSSRIRIVGHFLHLNISIIFMVSICHFIKDGS